MASELPQGAISPIEWRATGIKYTNNEFYLDIVESLDCIIDKYAFLFFFSNRFSHALVRLKLYRKRLQGRFLRTVGCQECQICS